MIEIPREQWVFWWFAFSASAYAVMATFLGTSWLYRRRCADLVLSWQLGGLYTVTACSALLQSGSPFVDQCLIVTAQRVAWGVVLAATGLSVYTNLVDGESCRRIAKAIWRGTIERLRRKAD